MTSLMTRFVMAGLLSLCVGLSGTAIAEDEMPLPETTAPETTAPEAIEPEAIEPEAIEPEAIEPAEEATQPDEYLPLDEASTSGSASSVTLYLDFGDYYLKHGMMDEAAVAYRKALDLSPDSITLLTKMGEVLTSQGRLLEALAIYERAAQIAPDNADVRNNLAVALIRSNRLVEAESLLKEIIKAQPRSAIAQVNLGVVYIRSGRLAAAVKIFERAAKIEPDNGRIFLNVGNAYLNLNNPEEALKWYDRAIENDPAMASVHNSRGTALHRLDRLEAAAESYAQAVSLDAENPLFYFNLGVVEADLRHPEASISAYRQVLTLHDEYPEVHNNQGVNYFQVGGYVQAEVHFTRAAEQERDDPVPLNNLCVLHLAKKRPEKALEACERALAIQPDYRDARYNRLQALVRLSRFDRAKEEGNALLAELGPGHPFERAEILTALSAAHFSLGELGSATDAARQAIEIAPDLAAAYYNLGRAYQEDNRNKKALAAYLRATQLNERDAESFTHLGEIYDRLRLPEEAAEAYRQANMLKRN